MSLEGDNHEQDSGNTGEHETSTERCEAPSQVTPTGSAPHPPQPPPCTRPPDKNPSKWRGNTKLGLEIGGLVVLSAYTVFSALQWLQIRWTNRMTREALNGSSQALIQTLNKMQEQTNQTARLAMDTETANTNVINADRPWMGGYIAVGSFAVGSKPTFTITFMNSGRRPARLDLTAYKGALYPSFPRHPDKEYSADTTPSTSVIVPGQQSVSSVSTEYPLGQGQMDLLVTEKFTYFVFAKVEYRDLRTNEHHWTHICERYVPKAKTESDNGFRNCTEYNDAD